MRDRVDDRLEHRGHVELGTVHASEILERGNSQVPSDEPAGTLHLDIQRAAHVGGIKLVGLRHALRLDLNASVGNCLDERVGQPAAGIPGRHEDPGHRRPEYPVIVLPDHAKLGEQAVPLVPGPRSAKPLPMIRGKRVHGGVGNHLLVEALFQEGSAPVSANERGR